MNEVHSVEAQDLRRAWPPNTYDSWIEPEGKTNLVSVIIPVYNRAALIEETLSSIQEQTYRPIEIVIVDDGSEDDTPSKVRSWMNLVKEEPDLRAEYLRQSNQGVSAARNRGVVSSTGEYIQFLDSDDKLHPKKLESQVRCLEDIKVGYVYCRTARFGEAGKDGNHFGYDVTQYDLARVLVENPYHTSAALYRRKICSMAGPWARHLDAGEDWEYAIRVLLASRGHVLFQEEVYNFHRIGRYDRLSGKGQAFITGRLDAMSQNEEVLAETNVLENHTVARTLSLNYLRMAFELHDHSAEKASINEALQGSWRTAPVELWPVLAVLFALHCLSQSAFGKAKDVIRLLRSSAE